LDLGCGCGEFLYLLESRGYTDLHGVDLCKEEVEFANQYCRANVQHGEVLDYLKKCPDNSFGAVSALNLLEHLEDDILLALLPEVRRVLRPGGVLLAMVPNAISPFSGTTRYWDITHRRAFTANNFRQLAALTGFRPNVEVRECGPFPHGAKSGIRYAMWQVLRLLVAAWFIVEVADAKGGVYTMDMIVRLERD
jgi:SAM-dependent methyltransferase